MSRGTRNVGEPVALFSQWQEEHVLGVIAVRMAPGRDPCPVHLDPGRMRYALVGCAKLASGGGVSFLMPVAGGKRLVYG